MRRIGVADYGLTVSGRLAKRELGLLDHADVVRGRPVRHGRAKQDVDVIRPAVYLGRPFEKALDDGYRLV